MPSIFKKNHFSKTFFLTILFSNFLDTPYLAIQMVSYWSWGLVATAPRIQFSTLDRDVLQNGSYFLTWSALSMSCQRHSNDLSQCLNTNQEFGAVHQSATLRDMEISLDLNDDRMRIFAIFDGKITSSQDAKRTWNNWEKFERWHFLWKIVNKFSITKQICHF